MKEKNVVNFMKVMQFQFAFKKKFLFAFSITI